MKNKKILLKLVLAIVVVAIMFVLKPINANATISGNENYRLVLVTTINNWETTRGFSNLTLNTNNTNGSVYDEHNYVSLDYTVSFYLSSDSEYDSSDISISDGTLYSDDFSNGDTVYLLEVYDFTVSNGYALDDQAISFTLPVDSYLSTYVENTALANTIMSGYSYNFAPTAYIDGVYDSSIVGGSESRNFYNMIYFNSGSKTDTISRGTIDDVKFYVSFTGSKSGNILPDGTFNVSTGLNGTEQVSYYNFINFANATITYEGTDDNYINENNSVSGNTSHTYTESQEGYGFSNSTNLNSNEHVSVSGSNYTVSRIMNVVNNKDNPTGIFYNVLPFVVAIVIAGAGVVLLKKNSIQ